MAYGFYRTITVDHTLCGTASSTDFPVLVKITGATSLKLVSSGGRINNQGAQSSPPVNMPFDLAFYGDLAGTVQYAWEVEAYNGVSGDCIVWVKVPNISNTVDTVFYMFYGDSTVTTQQNTGSFSVTNVWSSYAAVLHLASASSMLNSTGGTGATNNGLVSTTGQISGGVSALGGPNQSASIPLNLSGTNAITVEFWLKWTAFGSNDALLAEFTSSISANAGSFLIDPNSSGIANSFEIDVGGGSGLFNGGGFTRPTAGVFHHYAIILRLNNSTALGQSAFVDGSQVTVTQGGAAYQKAISGNFANSTMYLFSRNNASLWGNGVLDELRITTSARSSSWIAAEVNNQFIPGNIGTAGFLIYGAETVPSAPTISIPALMNTYRQQRDA